ncbi:MAG TPA: large conductance mechanosensitive channel protein MscL [Candidatus Dormibacteraeota bacterium]
MFRDFKQFLLRGNVVDLAVGIVIGGAFGTVVAALVKDFITPLIGAIFGTSKNGLNIRVGAATFLVGDFLDALLSFLLIAVVVFFLVVKPVNYLITVSRREDPPDPTTRKCPECLSEIPVDAKRCAFCTSELAAAS